MKTVKALEFAGVLVIIASAFTVVGGLMESDLRNMIGAGAGGIVLGILILGFGQILEKLREIELHLRFAARTKSATTPEDRRD